MASDTENEQNVDNQKSDEETSTIKLVKHEKKIEIFLHKFNMSLWKQVQVILLLNA